MPDSQTKGQLEPDIVHKAGGFVAALYDWAADILDRLLRLLLSPSRWLLQKLDTREAELRARRELATGLKRFGWWIAIQVVRLVSFVVYWASVGPFLIVYLIAVVFLIWAAFKPIFWSEWVGGLWIVSLFTWLVLREAKRPWNSFAKIAGAVTLGVTPQFLFLCAYNGFVDGEMTPPQFLQGAIHAYEYGAVWMYHALEPMREVAWFWWALGALGLLFLSYLADSPKLLATGFWLRGLIASVVFVVAVTTSLSLSSSIHVWNWEPNMDLRLKAALKEKVGYETELNLSERLKDWFAAHKKTQTVLPAYVQTFEKALSELNQRRDQAAQNDLKNGARTAMKALVPKELGEQLGKEPPQNGGPPRNDEADISKLMALETQMKVENVALAARANQARAATVNFIAQIMDVSVTSVPLLKEIVGEMINTSAEILSERMLERLPIEKAVAKGQEVSSEVGEKIAQNIDALALGLFTVHATARQALNGLKLDEVKARINEETHRVTVAREEAARARESARRARAR